jgi:AraC-like DNA-binding protein
MPIAPEVYKKIVAGKLYIDERFHEPIDLDRIAREACLSRFHFHRLFTRIYRLTPHQYLTRKRIEQARKALAERTLTVTEICAAVGFESIGSFSTLFKKTIGHAPNNYRQQEWQKNIQAREQPLAFIPHCFIETSRKSNSEEAHR